MLQLERGRCWVVVAMVASGWLNFHNCCALGLDSKSQLGISPICASAEGCIMPRCTTVARLLVLACKRPEHLVDLSSSDMPFYNHLDYNEMAAT
jgi:hypothetical protein